VCIREKASIFGMKKKKKKTGLDSKCQLRCVKGLHNTAFLAPLAVSLQIVLTEHFITAFTRLLVLFELSFSCSSRMVCPVVTVELLFLSRSKPLALALGHEFALMRFSVRPLVLADVKGICQDGSDTGQDRKMQLGLRRLTSTYAAFRTGKSIRRAGRQDPQRMRTCRRRTGMSAARLVAQHLKPRPSSYQALSSGSDCNRQS
jgi:hypothetical protein